MVAWKGDRQAALAPELASGDSSPRVRADGLGRNMDPTPFEEWSPRPAVSWMRPVYFVLRAAAGWQRTDRQGLDGLAARDRVNTYQAFEPCRSRRSRGAPHTYSWGRTVFWGRAAQRMSVEEKDG